MITLHCFFQLHDSGGLVITGKHVDVHALRIPESSLNAGIGFGDTSKRGINEPNTRILSNDEEIADLHTAIFLPPGIPSLTSFNNTSTYHFFPIRFTTKHHTTNIESQKIHDVTI